MRHCLSVSLILAAALAGCGPRAIRHVSVDKVPLGKVVVYRNGVAFYERRAQVAGGKLTVRVPRERVDDFLKSLTVVEQRTAVGTPGFEPGPGRRALIRGRVSDRRSGEPVAGVTVAARAGAREVIAITDEDGGYEVEVDTGAWALTFYYGDLRVERRPEPAARGWVRVIDQVIATELAIGKSIIRSR